MPAAPLATPTSIFFALLLAGLLGMVGQGVRAVVGLKKLNEDAAAQGVSSADLFIAARLIVSLLIGFIAGIAAGLALSLGKILAIGSGDINILLGIAAAGYAGTDFIEAFAPTITSKAPPLLLGGQLGSSQTPAQLTPAPIVVTVARAPPVPASPVNPKYGVTFGSLIPGGFFSADPDDLNVHRSIRTNNPGALNFSSWQKSRLGYVGITQPDNSPDHNVTTIYRTPEHGVAAWYHLLAVIYDFSAGSFTLNDLAARYGGVRNPAAIPDLVAGWSRGFHPPIVPGTQFSVNDTTAMLSLAKAMFSHEAGMATPVRGDQIAFALDRELSGTLPA